MLKDKISLFIPEVGLIFLVQYKTFQLLFYSNGYYFYHKYLYPRDSLRLHSLLDFSSLRPLLFLESFSPSSSSPSILLF